MSYKPLDSSLWSKVSEWSVAAPTKEAMIGKPVLIVAWASWYKTSHGALAEAQRLAEKNSELVVVGIHHSKGFAKAAEVLTEQKITFPVGHDADGLFFQALHVPAAGPDFYLIDRAGNLRFADLERASLADAVKVVVDETSADAGKAPLRAKEAQKAAGDAPLSGPAVKTHVAPEDYKQVKWPATNKGEMSARNFQGKPLPAKLGKEKWLSKAPDTNGKIVVLDFWATWCPLPGRHAPP